jgi:hypothetical protein
VLRTITPLACRGDAGRWGQGEEGGCSARAVRDRAACGDELGTAAEAGLWHRRGELRALRFCGQGDRQHRGAGADRTDPRACERERRKQRGIARPTIDKAAGECVSGAGEGGRIGSREGAIRDRQGAVLRAAEMRRDPGDCSGCEGRCAFPGWSCRQDQFAGWIPVLGPGAGAGRAGLALGGVLSFLYFAVPAAWGCAEYPRGSAAGAASLRTQLRGLGCGPLRPTVDSAGALPVSHAMQRQLAPQ